MPAAPPPSFAPASLPGYPYARPTRSFIFVNSPQQGPAAYTFADAAWVPPSSWQGRLQPLLDLQVSVDQKEGRIDR